MEGVGRQSANLDSETESEKRRAEELSLTLQAAISAIAGQNEKVAGMESQISEFEGELSADRQRQMVCNSRKNEIEVSMTKLKAGIDYIADRMLADYDTPIAEVDWKLQIWKSDLFFLQIQNQVISVRGGCSRKRPQRIAKFPRQIQNWFCPCPSVIKLFGVQFLEQFFAAA